MNCVLKGLKYLDTVGPQFSLTYRKQSRMKTALGGAVVLVIYTVITLGLFYFSRDFLFKINPITKTNKTFRDSLEMPVESFPLYFFISDRFVKVLKPGDPLWDSIELSVEYWVSVADEEGNNPTEMYTFKLEPCSVEYFKGYEDSVSTSVNNNSLCIDYSKAFNQERNVVEQDKLLKEYSSSGSTSFLNIKVKICDETVKSGCRKPLEEEGQLLFFMGYPTAIVNFDDYDQPVTNSLSFFQNSISPGLFSRKYASLNINELISDNGLVLTDTSSENYIQTQLFDTDVIKYSENSRSLFAFTFRLNLIKETMERRYTKIQEILANVGGFLKTVSVVATLLVKTFSEYKFFKSFGKELSSVPFKKEKSKMVNTMVSKSKSETESRGFCQGFKPTIKVNTEITFRKFLFESVSCRKSSVSEEKLKVFRQFDIGFISSKLVELTQKIEEQQK